MSRECAWRRLRLPDAPVVTFANMWVALGGFSIASGWAILATRARSRPGWAGGLSAGVGLVAARAVWTSAVWLIPYALFWVWILVVSSRMLRKRPGATRRST